MKALLQRVSRASVTVADQRIAQIDTGLLVLIGVEKEDDDAAIDKMLHRLTHYRVFSDKNGRMNVNLLDHGGDLLLVSQFTLVADTRRGLRPGFSQGATPEHGKAVFERLVEKARTLGPRVETGEFGADMQVELVNDGPVTFMLEA